MHEPAPFCSLHMAFGPQGDGMHGDCGVSSISATKRVTERV